MYRNPKKLILVLQGNIQSSRGGLGGKATTMFKHSCNFSPGGSNPAWGINMIANELAVYPWTVICKVGVRDIEERHYDDPDQNPP